MHQMRANRGLAACAGWAFVILLAHSLPGRAQTAPAAQPAAVVADIVFTGLKLIPEREVRSLMKLAPGAAFAEDQLARDVAALADSGWFDFTKDPAPGQRVSKATHKVNAQGKVEVLVDLVENPVVERIELGVTPAPTAEQLAKELPFLIVGRPLNTNDERLNQSLIRLEELYRQLFKLTVKVALPAPGETPRAIEGKGPDRCIVHLKVTGEGLKRATPGDEGVKPVTPGPGGEVPLIPGEKLTITEVAFLGARKVSVAALRDVVQTKPGALFNRDKLRDDVDRLYGLGFFYFEHDKEGLATVGYPVPAGAGTHIELVPSADGRGLTIKFHLVENPVIKEVVLTGNRLFNTAELLKDLVYLRPGNVLNTDPKTLALDEDRLIGRYSRDGYVVFIARGAPKDKKLLLTPVPRPADAKPDDPDQVIVTLAATEARIHKILFEWEGPKRTKEVVFRADMKLRPGEYYNFKKIQDDLRRVYRRDLVEKFEGGTPEPDPDNPDEVNIKFKVKEKRTGNVSLGGGVSSRYGLVGFGDISQSNLFGLAQKIGARIEFGGRFNANISYYWPLLDRAGTETNFRIYNTDDKTGATGIGAFTTSRTNFNQTRRGGSASVSRPIVGSLRGSIGYRVENVTTSQRGSLLPNLPPFPFQDLRSDTTSSFTFGIDHDTRDFPMDATQGMYQELSLETAGTVFGGDNNFLKYKAEARNYWPVLWGTIKSNRPDQRRPAWVLATRAQVGWSSGRLPFSQSYFIGGSETLRGYTEDRFFGNRSALFNVELRRAFTSSIQMVVFGDAGRAWRQGEPMDFFGNLATSLGVGLRLTTPLGPIRFDLAKGGEGRMRTEFGFGQTF